MNEQEALAKMVAPGTRRQVLLRFQTCFTKGDPGECWLWVKGIFPSSGYGQFKLYGTPTNAHRVSYELYVAPIPPTLWVLHKCDVRRCVNPDHLFLGTALDNNRDMIAKGRGRSVVGEDCKQSVITEEIVRWIRRVYVPRHRLYGQSALARSLDICQQQISRIILRQEWRHVT